jgi:hypothetical protein
VPGYLGQCAHQSHDGIDVTRNDFIQILKMLRTTLDITQSAPKPQHTGTANTTVDAQREERRTANNSALPHTTQSMQRATTIHPHSLKPDARRGGNNRPLDQTQSMPQARDSS